jgi:DNA-binding NarL/FixJ family response regulator
MADDSLALLPLEPDRAGPPALLIRTSSLLRALRLLFDALWADATPLTALPAQGAKRGEAAFAAEDMSVLTLLAAGLKDESIARELHISPRSAQRRVSGLMKQLGVHTRFQAGLQAGRRGLIQ